MNDNEKSKSKPKDLYVDYNHYIPAINESVLNKCCYNNTEIGDDFIKNCPWCSEGMERKNED